MACSWQSVRAAYGRMCVPTRIGRGIATAPTQASASRQVGLGQALVRRQIRVSLSKHPGPQAHASAAWAASTVRCWTTAGLRPAATVTPLYPPRRLYSTAAASVSVTCWKCGHVYDVVETKDVKQRFFCPSCGTVQEPEPSLSAFDVFGLKPGFTVDLDELEAGYRTLQRALHPDKFSLRSEEEQRLSALQSAVVNTAYDRLRRPLQRALHMLELAGAPLEEKEQAEDPEFLMEVFELNEAVEEAQVDPSKRQAILETIEGRISETIERVQQAFDDDNTAEAKEATIALRYYINMKDTMMDRQHR